MNNIIKWFIGIFLFLGVTVSIFYWFEAEKEIRILCSMFAPGQTSEQVIRTLNTGHHLDNVWLDNQIHVDSPKTLRTSTCKIQFSEIDQVISSQYNQSFSLNKIAAWAGSIGFILMAIFQFGLAIGLPYGKLAWGGFYNKLPPALRIGSAISILIYGYGILVLLESAHIIQLLNSPQLVEYSVWSFAILFSLSTIGNLQSKSEMEKKVMTPVGILFFFFCITVGMAG